MSNPPVHLIPLADIDDEALPRDRTTMDDESLMELRHSIALNGLRLPIEVFELNTPGPHYYGLISGYRRLKAFRAQFENTGKTQYAVIPAFIRAPGTLTEALVSMVEENEIRADLSPWERGRIALTAREMGLFPTIEEAVNTLFPTATGSKRTRLRAIARLAEELDGQLTAPDTLSQAQALRLAACLRAGFGPLIRATLSDLPESDPESQWQALIPILLESERPRTEHLPNRPGRPRRLSAPRAGLTIRREQTRTGYSLHFTGRSATSALLDAVFDEIDNIFQAN